MSNTKACNCVAQHKGRCPHPRLVPAVGPSDRTPEQIQADYVGTCTRIGDLEYRLKVGIPLDLAELYERAKTLNAEHAAALKAAKEKSNG